MGGHLFQISTEIYSTRNGTRCLVSGGICLLQGAFPIGRGLSVTAACKDPFWGEGSQKERTG